MNLSPLFFFLTVSLTIGFLRPSLLRVPSAYLSFVKVTSELVTLAVSLTVGFLRPSILRAPSVYLGLAFVEAISELVTF